MAIAAVFEFPSEPVEKYHKVFQAGDAIVDQPDRMYHVCYRTGTGFTVVDIWADEQSFATFGETLGPAIQRAGLDAQPARSSSRDPGRHSVPDPRRPAGPSCAPAPFQDGLAKSVQGAVAPRGDKLGVPPLPSVSPGGTPAFLGTHRTLLTREATGMSVGTAKLDWGRFGDGKRLWSPTKRRTGRRGGQLNNGARSLASS